MSAAMARDGLGAAPRLEASARGPPPGVWAPPGLGAAPRAAILGTAPPRAAAPDRAGLLSTAPPAQRQAAPNPPAYEPGMLLRRCAEVPPPGSSSTARVHRASGDVAEAWPVALASALSSGRLSTLPFAAAVAAAL